MQSTGNNDVSSSERTDDITGSDTVRGVERSHTVRSFVGVIGNLLESESDRSVLESLRFFLVESPSILERYRSFGDRLERAFESVDEILRSNRQCSLVASCKEARRTTGGVAK